MCGRYALGIRATFVRYQLQQQGMQVDNAPDDDAVRETYNFPPGSFGLVYRAEVPDSGYHDDGEDASQTNDDQPTDQPQNEATTETGATDHEMQSNDNDPNSSPPSRSKKSPKQPFTYELKPMKWGLIPFWTKRSPDYSSMLRTINCRDDSLIENRGMWTSMKLRKRCLVIAQGFYEWLKKGPPGSKQEKVPHFVKRKDGQLMCFAGLWDCVKYEDPPEAGAGGEKEREKLYSYTIITTDSNKQLTFLHDRMPVILDPNSEAMKLWLDPTVTKWSKELQGILKPFEGELECYPVIKDVGKVGNNSPDFIVPVDSKENKKNIANFFGNAAKKSKGTETTTSAKSETKPDSELKTEETDKDDTRQTKDTNSSTENQAPMPIPPASQGGTKRKIDPDEDEAHSHEHKQPKLGQTATSPPLKQPPLVSTSPVKSPVKKMASAQSTPSRATSNATITTTKKTRSATSNEGLSKKPSPVKSDGTQRITNFFGSKDGE